MGALEWMAKAATVEFKARVEAFMWVAVNLVVNEDPATQDHTAKLAVARKIINGQINVIDFTKAVATDEDLRAIIDAGQEPTDAQVRAAVFNLLQLFAKGQY